MITIFLGLFHLLSLALATQPQARSISSALQPRAIDTASFATCARDCYARILADSARRGSCSESDTRCLCEQTSFREAVENCWDDDCSDGDERRAWSSFTSQCVSAGARDFANKTGNAISGAIASGAAAVENVAGNVADRARNDSDLNRVPLLFSLIGLLIGLAYGVCLC